MKKFYIIALLSLFFALALKAQENHISPEKIDGNSLIKKLLNERYQFNKALIKQVKTTVQSPQPKSFLKSDSFVISFSGRDYVINNRQVVEIKGILLSKTALAAIAAKLALLDDYQIKCSESVNAEYKKDERNLQYIKKIDRQYFSYLKQITTITADIAHSVSKPNASITIEMAMDKVRVPLLNISNNQSSEVLLAKAR